MKTAVLTDTNSGLTVEEGRKLGIYVLPMPVIIDDQCYLEGVDISNRQLYDALIGDRNVSSSQPSPGDVAGLWEQAFRDGYEELVHIPMSSGLSGSCHSAMQQAGEYGGRVHVVDNHRISITLKESVLEAKRLVDLGSSAGEIKEALEKTAYDSSIYVTVDSLKYLKKSGRITASAAAVANLLGIKPVLSLQGEKLDLFAKVRGFKQSEKKMIEALKADVEARFSGIPWEKLKIGTAGTFETPEEAGQWNDEVQAAFPECKVSYTPLSCSIACHVGVGAAGLGISVIS